MSQPRPGSIGHTTTVLLLLYCCLQQWTYDRRRRRNTKELLRARNRELSWRASQKSRNRYSSSTYNRKTYDTRSSTMHLDGELIMHMGTPTKTAWHLGRRDFRCNHQTGGGPCAPGTRRGACVLAQRGAQTIKKRKQVVFCSTKHSI